MDLKVGKYGETGMRRNNNCAKYTRPHSTGGKKKAAGASEEATCCASQILDLAGVNG
jgi:hypothetical protein